MSLSLNINDIFLLNTPITKVDAINMVAEKMVNEGLVKADYAGAMFDRDAQISTFLGNGIAIPHGTTEKRDSVINTGLKVLYVPQGVKWDEENIAYVIIGIAAKSNEHLDVLRQLTRVVIDESALDRIKSVKTAVDLLAILTGKAVPQHTNVASQGDREFIITLPNPHGLHTRPAAILVKEIKIFDSDIQVANIDNSPTFVNAKSMMKLVSLGVKFGQKMKFVITGVDAVQAEEKIKKLIGDGLGEDISSI